MTSPAMTTRCRLSQLTTASDQILRSGPADVDGHHDEDGGHQDEGEGRGRRVVQDAQELRLDDVADHPGVGNVIQSQFLRILDYPTAAALSFILMAAILAVVTVYIRKSGTEDLV